PNNVEALFKLGNSYAVLGYYVQAIERWNKVVQLTPDAAVRKSAQDNISRAQAKIGQLSMTTQPNQGPPPGPPGLEPSRAQARTAYEQGVRQIGAKDYGGAMQSLTQAIQLEPTLAVAYVARGSANIGLRRYSEAAADYESALRLDGSMASPLYGLGEAFRAMGRLTDAKQYYERYASSVATDVRPELQREARQKADKLR
ncbi:MAG TPA: tetratricopeptide repeat protein, partial [Myxococcaceae bacterium]|nr:tetratricopeptide repeat protein [Myxococcaceae bacterium]